MNRTIALIDYGSGNIHSACKACERVLREETLFKGSVLSAKEPTALEDASHIILPGVGAFADCLSRLGGRQGAWAQALERHVREKGKAFLGICVGMQLLATQGFEFGCHQGLGWLDGVIRPFSFPSDVRHAMKIPHMGWNALHVRDDKRHHPLFKDIRDGSDVYFVHSYHLHEMKDEDIFADCLYGARFPAWVGYDNIIGTQFHPEKSQHVGLTFLRNFIRWTP
ncbi:MAG: imidazole glycerol phosphate synthase subunit HisH [Alphaproteobacteria bacterium GM7ARS4]|nr:imidazole glycerol phosphate synthase subunit HisH [Alphaproteobacteria bacterium GM7ARS4]